jgi:hypothetical protein
MTIIKGGVLSGFFLCLLMLSSMAPAASSYYGGFFALQQYDRPDLENTVTTQVAYGRLGSHLSEWAAFEGRIGFGLTEESVAINGRDNQVRADNAVGIYLKLYPHWFGVLGPYALVGYSRIATTETRVDWFPRSLVANSLSLGAGADWFLRDRLALNVEWSLLADDADITINALQLGLTQYF